MWFSAIASLAQESDALYAKLAQVEDNQAAFFIHRDLADYWMSRDSVKTVGHLEAMDSLLSLIDSDFFNTYIFNQKAQWANLHGNHLVALNYFLKGLEIAQEADSLGSSASFLNMIGATHYYLSQYDSALLFMDSAYQLKIEIGADTNSLAVSLNNLAIMAEYNEDYGQALEYYFEALDLFEQKGSVRRIAMTLNNIGVAYKETEEYDLAVKYFLQSYSISLAEEEWQYLGNSAHNIGNLYITIGNDSADFYLEQSLQARRKMGDKRGLVATMDAIGEQKFIRGQFEQALKIFVECRSLAEELGERHSQSIADNRLARVHYALGNYQKGIDMATRGLAIAEEIGSLERKVFLEEALAIGYANLNNHREANIHLREYMRLDDSLVAGRQNEIVQELMVKYETEQREKEISQLKITTLEKDGQLAKSRIWQVGGFMLAAFLLVLTIVITKNSKISKELDRQKLLQKQKSFEELQQKNQLLAMTSVIQGQELERSRIAQDLHDGLGGLMSSIKSHFQNIQQEVRKLSEIDIYKKTKNLINEASDEVRRISHNMMPASLQLLGLPSAVEDLGDRLRQHDLATQVEILGERVKMDESREIMIYRIIQELSHNVVKHAEASHLLIQLVYTPNQLSISVDDDGLGFESDSNRDGLGLKSLKSRVSYLQGTCRIESTLKGGTSVQIEIPLS